MWLSTTQIAMLAVVAISFFIIALALIISLALRRVKERRAIDALFEKRIIAKDERVKELAELFKKQFSLDTDIVKEQVTRCIQAEKATYEALLDICGHKDMQKLAAFDEVIDNLRKAYLGFETKLSKKQIKQLLEEHGVGKEVKKDLAKALQCLRECIQTHAQVLGINEVPDLSELTIKQARTLLKLQEPLDIMDEVPEPDGKPEPEDKED